MVELLTCREKIFIDKPKQPGFSIALLRQAFAEQDGIHLATYGQPRRDRRLAKAMRHEEHQPGDVTASALA
jgi:hypothetical protein